MSECAYINVPIRQNSEYGKVLNMAGFSKCNIYTGF